VLGTRLLALVLFCMGSPIYGARPTPRILASDDDLVMHEYTTNPAFTGLRRAVAMNPPIIFAGNKSMQYVSRGDGYYLSLSTLSVEVEAHRVCNIKIIHARNFPSDFLVIYFIFNIF
jgi:hypothetical protein